jgi:hypothetical protein
MDRGSHEINCKTVQISMTTHLSVMGKTIQLIDSATGNIIKEKNLERDVIDWHLVVDANKFFSHFYFLE